MADPKRAYDREICLCFHVNFGKIVKHIRLNNIKRASQLSECYGAGTGCGWCVPFLESIFEKVQAGEDPTPSMSAEEYRKRRADYHKTLKKPKGLLEDTLTKILDDENPDESD